MLPERTTTIGDGESVYRSNAFHRENAEATIMAKLIVNVDYQSRRFNTRYRPSIHEAKLQFTHTLNGTAMAVPRIIIAILESGLQDGSVEIPQVLRKYIGVDSIQTQ
jgi:seryl-tRNA synthetase